MTHILGMLIDPLAGTILGIVGIVLAIVFYIRSKKTSLLAYQMKSTTVVGTPDADFSSDLEISYRGQKVPRVTSSTFVVWNSGSEVLHGKDMAAGDVLRFMIREPHLTLGARILKSSRAVNGVSVSPVVNGFAVHFEFLEHDEGFVFEILHSGPKEAGSFVGTLIGSKNSPKRVSDRINFPRTRLQRALCAFEIVAGGLLFCFATASVFRLVDDSWLSQRSDIGGVIVMIMTAALTLGLCGLFWLGRRRYPTGLET